MQVLDLQKEKPTDTGWLFCCLVNFWLFWLIISLIIYD